MANRTTNYGFIKPTKAESANVDIINANMESIDDILHDTQISLAPAYDQNETYNTGDKVQFELLMYKCKADGVTGAWDSTKWERTTAVEGSGADLDIYGEASGTAEASFSDGAEASLVECEIGIVPTQDLHGYSKPWAGGAGKNKIILTVDGIKTASGATGWIDNQKVVNDVTFTILTDNSENVIGIKANGTASAQITFSFNPSQTLTEGDYLSGCEDGANDTYGIGISQIGIVQTTTDHAITSGEASTNRNFYIRIMSGVQVDNVIFYPMLRTSTAPSGFEPYSNICPISGHTDVTVTVASTSGGSGEDTTVSLGRTVYGGTLDVTTGELTVTKAYKNLTTARNISGTYQGSIIYNVGSPETSDADFSKPFICNSLKYVGDNPYSADWKYGACINANSSSFNLWIKDGAFVDVADATTYLGTHPTEICYYLATPQTFNLTKEQIQTLLGQNYVSHDGGGTISLVYIKKDSTIIPNPTGAEIPLTGIEIDGEKFKIVPETEDIAEMEWTLLDSTTSTGTSTLIPEGTKYLVLVVDFSVSASIVAIESIKNIIKTMAITSKSVWNVGYEWCDTGGNHTYVAMSGDATHVQAYSGYNTVTVKVYAVS